MKQYTVTGMSCAACSARVERAVSAVEGVTGCSVNLLTNSMGVEGTADESAILRAVKEAGYGACPKGGAAVNEDAAGILKDHESPKLLQKLLVSLAFLLLLMYVAMGHTMWSFPLPACLAENPMSIGLVQLLLSGIVLLIHKRFFVSGFRSVRHGAANMDTLVALGSSASFLWSVYALFRMSDAQMRLGAEAAAEWLHELYFESAAMILVLITVGKLLEAKSKGRTTNALNALMRLSPRTATVLREGMEMTVPVEELIISDEFIVRPGESIPADGVILEGNTAVNESALTGESMPVDKTAGDAVSAATINETGYIRCRATRVGEDTTLAQIIRLVSDATATKAPIARISDKVSAVFVPVVTGIALVTLIIWLLLGRETSFALARAISVLVISCPCALGLATPVAIMVGSGVGAKQGVLFKTAVSLEATGKVQIVALDKTGTITKGEPEITDVIPMAPYSENELLSVACALEKRSEHPLAKAVVRRAEQNGIQDTELQEFVVLPGNGLRGVIEGETVCGGSVRFISSFAPLSKDILRIADALADKGSTPLLFVKSNELLGILAASDTLKEESADAIRELRGMGIRVVMLTGDNERTARSASDKAGIEYVAASLLPSGKEAAVRSLREIGKTAMVGDGINDAPALTAADIGIAIGAGTDVALDAADVVLIKSRLSDVPAAIRLSRAVLRNIKENLFWAFFYNALCIPLAAGCYISLFGWALNPMIGAAAMSLSSFCVVTNALRLNLFRMDSSKRDRRWKKETDDAALQAVLEDIKLISEDRTMKKTMKIEGMMCPHCEAHTREALEAIDGVESAVASHIEKKAVVTLSHNVPDAVLTAAVEKAGYQVLGIE